MDISFHQNAWEDYLYWQKTDKKIFKRINELIKATIRDPYKGIGKPEALKFALKGKWSRRINQEHRLVYEIRSDTLYILMCRYHY
jgi:toxin YoeB